MIEPELSWYREGLRFSCTECGHCCRVEGYVWVDQKRIRSIARYLRLPVDDFGRRYVRKVGRRYALIEKPSRECIFWDSGCCIYTVRPRQCRTFPFWKENLDCPADWEETARECPGIEEGRVYSREEIEALLAGKGETRAKARSPSAASWSYDASVSPAND